MLKMDFVKQFINLGISVIPLHHRSKIPAIPSWEEFKTRMPTHTEYQSYDFSWLNYGVIAGWNDLAFLDFDDWYTFEVWKDYWTVHLHKPLPFLVLTARGVHVYVQLVGGGVNERRRGVDVKKHGYVVGPECVHMNGTQYVPVGELRLTEVCLNEILPLELFPNVCDNSICCRNHSEIVIPQHDTEYQSDPFDAASMVQDIDLISKIKRAVRIESFFSDTRRTSADGRWLAASCPFHEDHHPSLWIDVQRQICGCNVCGFKPMDAINLYSHMHNISNGDAVVALAHECGVWK